MSIAEFLNQYRSDNPIQQDIMNGTLRNMLLSANHSGMRFFGAMFVQWVGGKKHSNFHPDSLEQFCRMLNLETLSDLNGWTGNASDLDEQDFLKDMLMRKGADLPHDGNLTNNLDVFAMKNVLVQDWPISSGYGSPLLDFQFLTPFQGSYKMLPLFHDEEFDRLTVQDLFRDSTVRGREYIDHRYDCNDYALGFMAEMADRGRGNWAIGFVGFHCLDSEGVILGAHAVNSFLLGNQEDMKVVLGDPQTGEVWFNESQVTRRFMGQESIQIRELFY